MSIFLLITFLGLGCHLPLPAGRCPRCNCPQLAGGDWSIEFAFVGAGDIKIVPFSNGTDSLGERVRLRPLSSAEQSDVDLEGCEHSVRRRDTSDLTVSGAVA
jgi:hypothetical protein